MIALRQDINVILHGPSLPETLENDPIFSTLHSWDNTERLSICLIKTIYDFMGCSLHIFMTFFEGLFGCRFMAKACNLGRLEMLASASVVTTHT